ncbi:CAMK protein kinase [Purpureocillium lavendulum]|uniref:CAMK protein kinase n=1 Tax=Purpureocillium lavendulum TaxID=1247861 RepID=A0AB34FTL2_9HYPO|nr:CAMK protein kinase [Purpureocillium lavendulum]
MEAQFAIRRARADDVETITRLKVESFSQSPYQQAIFPEHLRIKPGLQDQIDWYSSRMQQSFLEPCNRYVVAVIADETGKETIAGFAKWVAPKDESHTHPAPPQEDMSAAQDGLARQLPAYLDQKAAERCDRDIGRMMEAAMPLFGGKKLADMWTLNSIAVDAAYRSRGIGKALVRWGMDSADAEGKDIWLISAPAGRAMYLSLGFKELAEGSRAGEGQYLMLRKAHGQS